MDSKKLSGLVSEAWTSRVVPVLVEYVRIPALSPAFDPAWAEHGHLDRAVSLARDWVAGSGLKGARIEIRRLAGRTPVLLVDVPGTRPGNALLYGHLDKQPPFEGWREGLSAWSPVIEGDRLYGRGAADDGYAVFAATTAIAALREADVPHPRCVILIEASEESGSPDLAAHVQAAREIVGEPDLVACLDSGCADYSRLWLTSSLRGMASVTLTAEVLREGVHSGDASGVVPSSFRILRQLLDRLEDPATGRVRLQALHADIPTEVRDEARQAAAAAGPGAFARFPWLAGVRPMAEDLTELVLNRTWRPTVSVIGADGLPPSGLAGNVLRPGTTLKLSVRLPPTVDAEAAAAALRRELERDPPSGAHVRVSVEGSSGFRAPQLAPWLREALDAASRTHFGAPACSMGEGGSIPFMRMLSEAHPKAQFVVTGVLGPEANAHGPNEFLHLPTGRALTACVAETLARMP